MPKALDETLARARVTLERATPEGWAVIERYHLVKDDARAAGFFALALSLALASGRIDHEEVERTGAQLMGLDVDEFMALAPDERWALWWYGILNREPVLVIDNTEKEER